MQIKAVFSTSRRGTMTLKMRKAMGLVWNELGLELGFYVLIEDLCVHKGSLFVKKRCYC